MHEESLSIVMSNNLLGALSVEPDLQKLVDEALVSIAISGRDDQYKPRHCTWVVYAKQKDKLLGLILWEACIHDRRACAFIGCVYVRPLYRRAGYYRIMLDCLLRAHRKTQGAVACVYESNTASVAAHTALGFKVYDNSKGLVSMELIKTNWKERKHDELTIHSN
jgi:L-amino acid N-acyltransferase YncA